MQVNAPTTGTITRIFATVTALLAVLYALYLIRSVIGLIAVSLFVAMMLGPPVELLTRLRLPRALAIVVVYIAIGVAFVGIATLFVPSVASSVQSLARNGPQSIDKLRKNGAFRKYDNRYKLTSKLKEQVAKLPSRLGNAAGALRDVTVGVFNTLVQLITVLTIAFFLLLDARRLMSWTLGLISPAHAERIRPLAERINRAVAGYVAGNLGISVIAGVVSFVTLTILGIPYAFPLSILMALFDLLPLVGATIGAIIVGVVTLFHGAPTSTIVWAGVQIAYQQVESSVIFPVVYRRTVHVNGLVTIVAVLVGAELLGILGALVAIPIAGAAQIAGQELWRSKRTGAALPVEEAT